MDLNFIGLIISDLNEIIILCGLHLKRVICTNYSCVLSKFSQKLLRNSKNDVSKITFVFYFQSIGRGYMKLSGHTSSTYKRLNIICINARPIYSKWKRNTTVELNVILKSYMSELLINSLDVISLVKYIFNQWLYDIVTRS